MSIRRTRLEYLKDLFRERDFQEMLKVHTWFRRKKKPEKIPGQWWYELPTGQSGTQTGFTRSEVRSNIKKSCGIKGRLPIGSLITCTKEAVR